MNKYKSRSEVPEKYKWDLSDFYKNDEDYYKSFEETKKKVEMLKDFVGCTKDSKKICEFLKMDRDVENEVENLYVYAFVKDDEELGKSENIDRKNKATILFSEYSTNTSFFEPELI